MEGLGEVAGMPGYARLPSTPSPPARKLQVGYSLSDFCAMVYGRTQGRAQGQVSLPFAQSGCSWLLFWPLPLDWGNGEGGGPAMAFFKVFAFDIGSGKPCALSSVRVLSWAQKS